MNKKVVIAIIVLIAGGALLYFTQFRSPKVPGQYDVFAQCLSEKNFVMYGSVNCIECGRQRRSFGDSFRFIEEIECDPRVNNNQVDRCISKEIDRTPTWIQEDEEGNTLYRFEKGYQALERLSEIADCSL